MILKELVYEVPFVEIEKKLRILYPNQLKSIEGYKNVYELLLKKRSRKSTTIIDIEWVVDEDSDGGGYWDVHGKEPNDDTKYALDLSTFSQWSGFTIGPKVSTREEKSTLLAHILWEMTFHGFTEKDTQKFIRQLNRAIKEPATRVLKEEDYSETEE